MPLIINTVIKNNIDGHLLDAKNVKGTYVVVSGVDSDTKEKLPAATRVEGTLVYDAKEKKSYRFTDGAWVEEVTPTTDIEEKLKEILAAGVDTIKGKNVYSGDFYFDGDNLYIKDASSTSYESVISTVAESEELGTTDGHMFNDTLNTAYIGGNTSNPKYVKTLSVLQEDGSTANTTKIYDIALTSDIPSIKVNSAATATPVTELSVLQVGETAYKISKLTAADNTIIISDDYKIKVNGEQMATIQSVKDMLADSSSKVSINAADIKVNNVEVATKDLVTTGTDIEEVSTGNYVFTEITD